METVYNLKLRTYMISTKWTQTGSDAGSELLWLKKGDMD